MSSPAPGSISSAIIAHIRAHGPVTVAEYMELCLAHPEWGYYMTRDPFGEKGDFTTAPEISQLFGEMLGAWAAGCWLHLGSPSPCLLVELGPGRGTLMNDVLRATKRVPGFHDALSVRMIETSPVLQAKQRQALEHAHTRITWHADLHSALEPQHPALFLANEFFDALPIHQYIGTEERRIGTYNAALQYEMSGAVTDEQSPASIAIVKQLSAHIAAHGGAGLIIDYGYANGEKGDTLQAVKNHGFVDALAYPGESDLTAHVDFKALAEAARINGTRAHGPIAQGTFLKRLGIELRAGQLAQRASQEQRIQMLSGLERLVAPGHMGELFKVLAITSQNLNKMAGF